MPRTVLLLIGLTLGSYGWSQAVFDALLSLSPDPYECDAPSDVIAFMEVVESLCLDTTVSVETAVVLLDEAFVNDPLRFTAITEWVSSPFVLTKGWAIKRQERTGTVVQTYTVGVVDRAALDLSSPRTSVSLLIGNMR